MIREKAPYIIAMIIIGWFARDAAADAVAGQWFAAYVAFAVGAALLFGVYHISQSKK